MKKQNRFDLLASEYDKNSMRVRLAQKVSKSIIESIAVSSKMSAMEIGCGTGLVTLAMQPMLKNILAIDASAGMLKELKQKIKKDRIGNVQCKLLDLEKQKKPLKEKFDLIFSSMTFHHLNDIRSIIGLIHSMLTPAGSIAIVDLEKEDGTFHDDNTGVKHFGLEKKFLLSALKDAGFNKIHYRKVFSISKETRPGKKYGIFLLRGSL